MSGQATDPSSGPDAQGPATGQASDTRSQRPTSPAFRAFVASGWGPRPPGPTELLPGARWAVARRARLSAAFPGQRLVVPAGRFARRSNDSDYRFRPHTAFAYLTGLGTDREPDSVAVFEPKPSGGHEVTLYFRPRADRSSEEFYASAQYGELWVGTRASLAELATETGLAARHLDELVAAVTAGVGDVPVRLVREADDTVAAAVDGARVAAGLDEDKARKADDELADELSAMRRVKDEWEIAELRAAVEATARGFADIARALPRAVGHPRGERVVEGAFAARSREEGNGLGYDVIAAAGAHACTLHWIRNDGVVAADDLVLIDAGIERDSLYTADVTRTLPASGRFSGTQRQVYEAVLAAADAAMATVRPGAAIRDVHLAAMRVLAQKLHAWGLLPVSVDEALDRERGGQHRRWMVHGTSHHLGLDVHDCARLLRSAYVEDPLAPGMVITIEPGLYFRSDDLLVPEELRGIGVRIEDDVVVTADGAENLSAMLPRTADAVEAWLAEVQEADRSGRAS